MEEVREPLKSNDNARAPVYENSQADCDQSIFEDFKNKFGAEMVEEKNINFFES